MTARQIVRFILGLVIATALLFSLLPRFGIPVSRMLPPQSVYARAAGTAVGDMRGGRYSFQAPDPKNPSHLAGYSGVAAAPAGPSLTAYGGPCQVRYEKTAPEINGLTDVCPGQSDTPPNRFVGPWMVWPLVALALGSLFSLVIAKSLKTENI